MTLEQLLERTKINFPKPLRLEEVDGLFAYISKRLTSKESGCIIRYKVSVFKEVGSVFELYEEKVPKTKVISVGGYITEAGQWGYLPMLCFDFLYDRNRDNLTSFAGISFQITPGDDTLIKKEVEVIDAVREQVNKYFSLIDEVKEPLNTFFPRKESTT